MITNPNAGILATSVILCLGQKSRFARKTEDGAIQNLIADVSWIKMS